VADNLLGRTPFSKDNEKYQGVLSDALDGLGRGLNNSDNTMSVSAKFVVRFVRTVVNISKHQMQYSPVGFIDMATKIRTQSVRKELFGKAMAGSIVTTIIAMKASEDETTFFAPTGEKEKAVFYASGRKPFSLKAGDKWIPFTYFGPWAFAVAIPAAVHYYESQNRATYAGERGEKLSATLAGLMSVFFQTTPIGPLSDLVEAVAGNQSGALEKLGGNVASQFVPFVSLLAYLSDIFDPTPRKTDGATDTILRKLPFIKEQLMPYMDLSGDAAKYDWSHYILPYDIGTVEEDGDRLWNTMWLDSLKGVYSDKKLKEIKEEMEKDELRARGLMK
jgi:hypothetical protein